ncbi:MAG: peptidylprolyl isomerase [Armatimonadota bacterium]|nr:peptidylprolyl isomerase [Armatimonadota bacterium]MDR7451679.1 peptidylprolyl isomerase [Armatimonadota bacterium]MDR7465703.1 peptidylprolyl isomerase [Armatimonadota bacterium]MDR7493612.1 peptidylprolyl isomerase [Armatimonadota bacterium]MDR7503445.1 peptidylprolyl isomerase [Armatimonadota bacterium]
MAKNLRTVVLALLLALAGTAAALALTRGMQQGTGVAATVNGEVIYRSELDREVAAVAQQYRIDLTSAEGRKQREEISRIVLDQMIEQRLILQEARKRHALATEAQVAAAVEEIRKNFPSDAEFQFALDQRNLTLDDLRKRLRTTLTVQNLQARVSQATVNSSEVARYYEQNRREFDRPEQVRVRHILVETEAEARLVLARLMRGEKFADLARQLSRDPGSKDQGGDLGFVARGQLVPEFERAAFALQPGQISGIVKTQYGYHVIQGIARQAGKPSTLAEVSDEIRRQLLTRKQEADFARWLQQVKQTATITRTDTTR